MTSRATGSDRSAPEVPPVSRTTRRRLSRAAGELAAACLTAMEQRQPWFASLPADQRAGIALVTQTGVASFVAWLAEPSGALTAEAFRIAPRDLARRLSLRQTVDLVRIATDVFEQHLPPLAADEAEHRALREAILRFGREIAFAAATVYAGAAETRGAWDARQEALVVDAVVRGPGARSPGAPEPGVQGSGVPGSAVRGSGDDLVSRAAALGWDPAAALRVVAGSPPAAGNPDSRADVLADLRGRAGRAGRSVLVGVQGRRLVVLVSEPAEGTAPTGALGRLVEGFGPGPVVVGPRSADLTAAHESARDALSGLRAAPGWPDAPRPVDAEDLLPERALCGDITALHRLVTTYVAPLQAAGGELLTTLACYLDGGGALEACARALFVHPNTVRYRLRRVSELTGRIPGDPRDAVVLRTALVAGRLTLERSD